MVRPVSTGLCVEPDQRATMASQRDSLEVRASFEAGAGFVEYWRKIAHVDEDSRWDPSMGRFHRLCRRRTWYLRPDCPRHQADCRPTRRVLHAVLRP